MSIGKVHNNGTINDGTFYSISEVNEINKSGGGSGADLPTPTVEDAGKAVVVGEDGKYTLGGGGSAGVNYDLSLKLTYGDDSTEIELINGSFNDLLNLMITEQPINAYIYAIYYSGSYQSNRTIRNCTYEANLNDAEFINIHFTFPNAQYIATIDRNNNVTLEINS